MVKAVVGEETRLKLVEDRLFQSGVPAQVGLVIGRLSPALDRGFVFDLVPTPPSDGGEPARLLSESGKDDKKKGSKGKSQADSSSLVIDRDWVSEHARQVSRMLLGGMNVVGVYLWSSESLFKTSNVVLWETVKGVAEASPFSDGDLGKRLLVHISYSPRRWTCRSCALGSSIASSDLRPCDFKMGRILNSFQTFKCNYNFDIRLPIIQESDSNVGTFKNILRNAISCLEKELDSAKGIVDGRLEVEDEPCNSDGLHEVELILPFMRDVPVEVSSQKEVVGVVVLSGTICSFAYLSPKEPISQALAAIKGDIIMSLQSRLEVICDEAEGQTDITSPDGKQASNEISTEKSMPQLVLHLSRQPHGLLFPRRVLVPWLGNILICDYLHSSETFEVIKDQLKELMSMEAPTDSSKILDLETEAIALSKNSFWDIAVPGYSASVSESDHPVKRSEKASGSRETNAKPIKSFDFSTLGAIFFLLLSVVVGLVLFIMKV